VCVAKGMVCVLRLAANRFGRAYICRQACLRVVCTEERGEGRERATAREREREREIEGGGEREGEKEGEGEGEGRVPAGQCSSYHTRAREGL